MAIYTVQDTTMTALGDAVRKQVGKYKDSDSSNPLYFWMKDIDSTTHDYSQWELNDNAYHEENWTYTKKEKLNIFDDVDLEVYDGAVMMFKYQYKTNKTGLAPFIGIRWYSNPDGSGGYHETPFISTGQNTVLEYVNEAGISFPVYYINQGYYPYFVIERAKRGIMAEQTFTCQIEAYPYNKNTSKYININTMTPAEMVDEINSWDLSAIDRYKQCIMVANYGDGVGKFYSIPSSDFIGVSQIGVMSFYNMYHLEGVEFPEGLIKIKDQAFFGCRALVGDIVLPRTLTELGSCVFGGTEITSVRILNDTTPLTYSNNVSINSTWSPFYQCDKLTNIYVPSRLYSDYMASYLGAYHPTLITPYGEFVFDKDLSTYLAYSNEKEYSISLLDFTSQPDFSITLDKNEYAEITDISINDDNTEITFKVKALNSEGVEELTVIVYGEVNTYTLTGTITVMETIPESTYEVVAVDGASYGFALNDNGYYESQNKGKSSTYALCQVNISNPMGLPVYFDCISYGESNYDYGILGAVNQTLSKSTTDDGGIKKNFKGLSSANIQTVEYTDASGDCFIQVKYRKDSSGDQNNDSLQFQVRFGE